MSRPNALEVTALMQVAREIRETTDESGYSVDAAVRQHPSFSRSRRPTSDLERELVLEAARRGASQVGLGAEEVSNGLDIIGTSGSAMRRYRIKRASMTAEGGFKVICGEGSSLLVTDPDAMIPEEKWVLGYTMTDEHTIEHQFAAEIVDWSGSGPVVLKFGPVIDLADHQPPRGFVSTDEDLEDFDGDIAGGAEAS